MAGKDRREMEWIDVGEGRGGKNPPGSPSRLLAGPPPRPVDKPRPPATTSLTAALARDRTAPNTGHDWRKVREVGHFVLGSSLSGQIVELSCAQTRLWSVAD